MLRQITLTAPVLTHPLDYTDSGHTAASSKMR
jgi:hypothetical protein